MIATATQNPMAHAHSPGVAGLMATSQRFMYYNVSGGICKDFFQEAVPMVAMGG